MAAPAVRVAVLVGQVPEQQAALGEVLGELLVGLLEEDAADQRDLVAEGAVRADGVDDGQAVGTADLEVVLTEGGDWWTRPVPSSVVTYSAFTT